MRMPVYGLHDREVVHWLGVGGIVHYRRVCCRVVEDAENVCVSLKTPVAQEFILANHAAVRCRSRAPPLAP